MKFALSAIRLIPLIFTAIQTVEKLATGLKGKSKQDKAVELVGDLLPLVEGAVGRDLVDDAQVQQAMRDLINAKVAFMNVVRSVEARKSAPAEAQADSR